MKTSFRIYKKNVISNIFTNLANANMWTNIYLSILQKIHKN